MTKIHRIHRFLPASLRPCVLKEVRPQATTFGYLMNAQTAVVWLLRQLPFVMPVIWSRLQTYYVDGGLIFWSVLKLLGVFIPSLRSRARRS
jgi:hypothetical protein